ncbi:hypothetical protein A2947_02360 [Candidatus Peribacteria bacterium RIFCSPLOWO2_01_FULL_54_110]|nr:MAG: hypothetical protein A2947_02360 [Candidatus Peribacteria bacterium RIFCSPLOWO2_01_FULL_54_110]
MNTFLTPQLLTAVSLAVTVHSPMKRKGDGLPYIVHPIAVFGLLAHWGADEDTCIAGLLHDVIEDAENDTQRTAYRKEIGEKFGKEVLEIVEGVTEQDKSLPWKERKNLYLQHLRNASKESLLVSCADRTHNTASLVEAYEKDEEEIWKRFNAPKLSKIWFMDQAVDILKERLDEAYLTELCSHMDDLKSLLSTTGNDIKIPKVGAIVYVESACYIDSPWRDMYGGKARISDVDLQGERIWIKLKGFPTTSYAWDGLEEMQEFSKKRYGDKWAGRKPDIRAEPHE